MHSYRLRGFWSPQHLEEAREEPLLEPLEVAPTDILIFRFLVSRMMTE